MDSTQPPPKICKRCKERDATLKIRSEAICGPCYRRFVNSKTIKRLEVLARDIGAAPTQTKRILVGLSLGASSASLVDVLGDSVQSHLKKRPTPAYDPLVVHVDADGSGDADGDDDAKPYPSAALLLLRRFRERYPRFTFLRVPLTAVLDLDTVDWAALPVEMGDTAPYGDRDRAARLQDFFARLPSPTSRADVLRLFVRHVLLSVALREGCRAVLLGCSTTALAEVTLGETAKGRGFSLPWLVGDGPVTVRKSGVSVRGDGAEPTEAAEQTGKLILCYPNRDLFRNELTRYTTLVDPPLTDLLAPDNDVSRSASGAVVSHKNISIEAVMSRYFAEVEESYPSIVANVVRTTAKLDRQSGEEAEKCCGLCGMELDELGDERWKGEIGDDGNVEDGRLCYGCSRAMRS